MVGHPPPQPHPTHISIHTYILSPHTHTHYHPTHIHTITLYYIQTDTYQTYLRTYLRLLSTYTLHLSLSSPFFPLPPLLFLPPTGVAGFEARNTPANCGYVPFFPASSPYVVSVGATQGLEADGRVERACSSDTGGVITSGGGWLWPSLTPSSLVSSFLTPSYLPHSPLTSLTPLPHSPTHSLTSDLPLPFTSFHPLRRVLQRVPSARLPVPRSRLLPRLSQRPVGFARVLP